ncbi:hypothetical protein [Actinomadura chokoriensis]|uniref:hypothetical protein n=1 Tax=Actinomadura chokoriensis TaxID=454156 RepID=UPI0031F8B0B5
MTLADLPLAVMTYAVGVAFTADIGECGAKMLLRLQEEPVIGRMCTWLPSWIMRAFGVWCLLLGSAWIFIL